jgi:hypothetical protein
VKLVSEDDELGGKNWSRLQPTLEVALANYSKYVSLAFEFEADDRFCSFLKGSFCLL